MRFRIVSIYIRKTALRPDEVRHRRRTDPSDIRNYLHKLRSTQSIGTSILRQHVVIDETTSAIVQDVSICVHEKKAGGWVGTVWLDSGRPFHPESTPWSGSATKATPEGQSEDPYVPLVLHRPKIAISLSPPESGTASPPASDLPPCTAFSCLPSQYGSSLSLDLARVDALYAFSELIALVSTTENQFLNLIQVQIDVTLSDYRDVETLAIENLKYLTGLPNDLIERNEEVVYAGHFFYHPPSHG
ncbi:hypothetical protein IL306_012658 [Fusarium sp. DS 682]|nr:hypothetical protein IL306_012658 [Fusarium sp. DS 682]